VVEDSYVTIKRWDYTCCRFFNN